MIPMFFSSFKCCEMVACANHNSSTKSLQIQAFWLMIYCRMATRAGCPKTLNKEANLFCLPVNISDLVSPIIVVLISQYYDTFSRLHKHVQFFYFSGLWRRGRITVAHHAKPDQPALRL